MIDNQVRRLVLSELEAIDPSNGDLSGVLRRGRRRQRTRYVAQTFGVIAMVGLIAVSGWISRRAEPLPEVAIPEPASDLSLIVTDGRGPGDPAEQLALLGGPPVVSGSATHLGSVATAHGRFDIVSHRSIGGGDTRFPDYEGSCTAVINVEADWSEAACESPLTGTSSGYGYGVYDIGYTFWAESPDGTATATITTVNAQTIDVEAALTTSVVFAIWELSWGQPDQVEFFDDQGELIERWPFTTEEPAPSTTSAALPTPVATTAADYGDGLSEPEGVPDSWLGDGSEAAEIQLLDSGVGIATFPIADAGLFDLHMVEGSEYGAMVHLSPEYVAGDLPQLVVRIAIDWSSTDVTIYGIAPLGIEKLSLVVRPRGQGEGLPEQEHILIERVFQRPSIDRTVFAQRLDGQVLLDLAPVVIEPWFVYPAGSDVEIDIATLETFGFQTARFPDQYSGPFAVEMFFPVFDMIVDSVAVDEFPTVARCQVPDGTQAPPNRLQPIETGPVLATARAALEEILTNGDLSASNFFQNGYVELVDSSGDIAFARPVIVGDLESMVVMLVRVAEVESGWTVTGWESSGC